MPKKLGTSASLKVTKKTEKVQPKLDYHLEVYVNDLVYKGEADSMLRALTDFVNNPHFPDIVKTKLIINYSSKNGEMQKFLGVPKGQIFLRNIKTDPNDLAFWAEKFNHEVNGH